MEKMYKEIEKEPICRSKRIIITCKDNNLEADFGKARDNLQECQLLPKDNLHMELLFEETALMLEQITKDFSAMLWFEKFEHYCCLKLTAKTDMSFEKKEELLGMATDGKNAMAKGFMAKIADIIETGLLDFDYVGRLQQEYGGVSVGFGSMGIYDGMGGIADLGSAWSLSDYKLSLSDAIEEDEQDDATQEAWDELEKSIVANIATDVIVGTKSNTIEMTIIKELKNE
ncbi:MULTISPECIES: hypothetical protein [unclassified Butyrivibrio]|uniref:hypothetical protein n=1 Tax=unclassified Butyrivibrio TaxID=2639466 RepID=UPI000400826F|nr:MULTISPECIES: hypothetical protein [unclassified Butyrivibrio]MCR5342834.1 hypothetical protein [Butyrivibrio sp.]